MKAFSSDQHPDQNDIVLAHFTDGTGPEVGKYQDGSIVLADGLRSRNWSDVAVAALGGCRSCAAHQAGQTGRLRLIFFRFFVDLMKGQRSICQACLPFNRRFSERRAQKPLALKTIPARGTTSA